MRLLFIAFADADHGLGHYYRTVAVIHEAHKRGHIVALASNVQGADYRLSAVNDYIDYTALSDILASYTPDWVVADILAEPPIWLTELVHTSGARLAMLNGVGRSEREARADLLWAQDGPEKAIIRPEVLKLRRQQHKSDKWFVWGGAADMLGLIPTFMRACPDEPAWLVTTPLSAPVPEPTNPSQVLLLTEGDQIYSPMAASGKAVLHLGMTCWELAALGVPMYLFSRSLGHLRDARRFQEMGLALTYPGVGLPDDETFAEFLDTPFTPTGKVPDGKGAVRFTRMLERT